MPVIGSPRPYDPHRDAAGYHFDAKLAATYCGFIERHCTHVKGELAGQRIKLEPWQRQIVSDLFGWVDADGRRRYREAFIYIPRKQSKTTLAAAIALAYFFTDQERGQEIYCAAAEQKQAALLWGIARQMIVQNPALTKRCKVFNSAQRIARELDGSFFTPLSSKARTKHGSSPSLAIIDEVHACNSSDLYETVKTGMGARRAPLMLLTTTADFARESLCNTMLQYARNVRDGNNPDPQYYPAIWETMPGEDWKSKKVWAAANPNLGISVMEEFYKKECLRAQKIPAYENEFRRLYLNQVTEQDKRWLTLAAWDECNAVPAEEGPCYGGLDLASTRDISAFVLYWPKTKTCRAWFWIPAEGAKARDERDGVKYGVWAKQDHGLTTTPGNITDYAFIGHKVQELAKEYDLQTVAYDPWNARQLAIELKDAGVDMVEHRQGFVSMNEPSKILERMVLSKELRHGGNAILRWMAGNVAVKGDPAGNIKPVKPAHSESAKIDGIVALIMAIGCSLLGGEEKKTGPSIYETRGAIII